jgi:D-alanyl-D-alanine carboxypeptidase/D-alanyl-D-alanine-endopeptidase (penicillin-binding protein 4)
MKKVFLVIGYWSLFHCLNAQSVKQKLLQAYQQFESDSQLRHAVSSLYVINAKTGKSYSIKISSWFSACIDAKNHYSATAFDLLGRIIGIKLSLG